MYQTLELLTQLLNSSRNCDQSGRAALESELKTVFVRRFQCFACVAAHVSAHGHGNLVVCFATIATQLGKF